MFTRSKLLWSVAAVLVSAAGVQADTELLARKRVFPDVGPGVRAVKRDSAGRHYVLTAPASSPGQGSGAAVLVYNAAGQRIGQVPAPAQQKDTPTKTAPLVYGDDLDVDAAGWLYVADRGANAVKVYAPDGSLALTVPIAAPSSVAALQDGEFAVASLKSTRLVTVFAGPGKRPAPDAAPRSAQGKTDGAAPPADKSVAPGRVVREFGETTELAERHDLNRLLNVGRLASDAAGHIYYAFSHLPEPTVRKYDRHGYAAFEVELATLDFEPAARAARREIEHLSRNPASGAKSVPLSTVTAIGVDHETQEIWVALHGLLLHFDKDGNRRGTYRTFTPEGARLEATAILVEADRLLLAADPLGIYEFPRPNAPRP